ncbi:MAG: aldehyde dehydrogenase family protein [Endomicrobia bacterium]|nr:aldehyde dehydrogenase family protein [Endomicrobiia bacterium]MCL2506943.1 aldehyde dehydrogenase family protein [Endomicrobiia bacterium]
MINKKINQFNLFVDGKEVDTGVYDYTPYSDKFITEFKNTYRIITKLKKDEIPDNADEYIYARYCVGDDSLNLKAIDAAHRAAKEFGSFPVSKRRKIMHDIHDNLEKNKDKFIKMLQIEGHPMSLAEWEYRGMELIFSEKSAKFYADELWREVTRFRNETLYFARRPDGVVCISSPKNASASNSSLGIHALLSGNTLIIKPPLKAPVSTIFLWKDIINPMLEKNGAPAGAINIVVGNSKRIMEQWLASPKVNDVLFFGESDAGLEIGRQCYNAGKKPILELSGSDPLIVWKDCDVDDAADSAMDAFLGSTQICMVPKKFIVHEDIYDTFVDIMKEKISKIVYGLPSQPNVILSPVVKTDTFEEYFKEALSKGAKLLCGGARINYDNTLNPKGAYVRPTLIQIDDELDPYSFSCVKNESFFPLIPVIKVKSSKPGAEKDKEIFSKMIDLVDQNEFGLRISAWIKSYVYIRQFIKYLSNSGLLRINAKHVEVSECLASHGGTRKTSGPFGEMNYMWLKTTHLQGITLARERRKNRRD